MASSVESEEIPEYLKCKVCIELPKAEVYQCSNGHIVCKSCYYKVEDCPQCRLPFDKQHPIRNRIAEEDIKGLWTECPFKSNGCTGKILKTKLARHRNECRYDFSRLGELVSICKYVGSLTCDFKFNQLNGKEAVEHLISRHILPKTNTNFKMELKSFKESAKGGSSGFTFWKPVIVELMEGFLVIMAVLKRKDASFTTLPIFLPDLKTGKTQTESIQVEFSVHHENSLDVEIWKREPISLDAKQPFPRKISFYLNSVCFRPHCNENGSLLINVKIPNGVTEEGEVRIECRRRIILSLTASLTPKAPERFDRLGASPNAKTVYNGIKHSCSQDGSNVLYGIKNIFCGYIPEGLELVDLKWIATELVFIAAQYGTVEAVKYLIGRKVNFNICTGRTGTTPLHLAVMDTDQKIGLEKAKVLVELGGANVRAVNDRKNSALHFSAEFGTTEFVKYFIKKGLSVNCKNVDGETPLFLTVSNDNEAVGVDIARKLLENGADKRIRARNGRTALDDALSNGKTKIAELFR